jgi:excisionase family DNA binding protein
MQTKILLTRTDASKILGVSVSTIRHWEASGKLESMRTLGGIRLFKRRDCEHLARHRLDKSKGESRSVLK